jgi:hypothetical protein
MTRDPRLLLLICDKEIAGFVATDPEAIERYKKKIKNRS